MWLAARPFPGVPGLWGRPCASPLLGFSGTGAPALCSCLCPTWTRTRGCLWWETGAPGRWNCCCGPSIRGRWCLEGCCCLPASRRRLAGSESCSRVATSDPRSRPAAVNRSKAVLILWANIEWVACDFFCVSYFYSFLASK